MVFGKAVVWFDVTDTALDAAVVKRGKTLRSYRVSSSSEWSDEALAGAMHEALQELDAADARVEVLWRRDGASSSVVQTPASGRSAGTAAVLNMIESGSVVPEQDAVEARVLGSKSDEGTHVLVSVVKQSRVEWVEQAVRDAGAEAGRIFAGESFAACLAMEDARASREADPVVSLVMGENVSAISIAVDGGTVLVRFAEIGMAVLREAYERAL